MFEIRRCFKAQYPQHYLLALSFSYSTMQECAALAKCGFVEGVQMAKCKIGKSCDIGDKK
jgi:hypothetical protein